MLQIQDSEMIPQQVLFQCRAILAAHFVYWRASHKKKAPLTSPKARPTPPDAAFPWALSHVFADLFAFAGWGGGGSRARTAGLMLGFGYWLAFEGLLVWWFHRRKWVNLVVEFVEYYFEDRFGNLRVWKALFCHPGAAPLVSSKWTEGLNPVDFIETCQWAPWATSRTSTQPQRSHTPQFGRPCYHEAAPQPSLHELWASRNWVHTTFESYWSETVSSCLQSLQWFLRSFPCWRR